MPEVHGGDYARCELLWFALDPPNHVGVDLMQSRAPPRKLHFLPNRVQFLAAFIETTLEVGP